MNSSFQYLAEIDALTSKLDFEMSCKHGFGALQIKGLALPKSEFNPLGKLWSSIKKRNREKFGVNVSGIFIYDGKDAVVSCSFCLDYGYQLQNELDQRVYEQRFIDTFDEQMETLKEALDTFMTDFDNGYVPYIMHIENNNGVADENFCEEMFNRFLISKGLKTKADMQRKMKLEKIKQGAVIPPWEK